MTAAVALLGCGSGTKHRTSAAKKQSDNRIGQRAGSNANCGSGSGQCACSDTSGYVFCAVCQANAPNICSYCPPGTFCPADPCGGGCYPSDPTTCPPGFAIECGNGACCPESFPACCPGGAQCGQEQSDCEGASGSPSGTSGTGGGQGLVCVLFTDNVGNPACSCMPQSQAPSGYTTTESCPSNDCCIEYNPPKGGVSCECNSNASNSANYGQGITCAGAAQKGGATVVSSCP